MAKEDEKKPTAAEKGKGKAPVNGDAEKDAKNGKDGKVDSEDKKGGVATATGMLDLQASCHNGLTHRDADTQLQRSSARKTNNSRANLICW
jgi:hypothetical protein